MHQELFAVAFLFLLGAMAARLHAVPDHRRYPDHAMLRDNTRTSSSEDSLSEPSENPHFIVRQLLIRPRAGKDITFSSIPSAEGFIMDHDGPKSPQRTIPPNFFQNVRKEPSNDGVQTSRIDMETVPVFAAFGPSRDFAFIEDNGKEAADHTTKTTNVFLSGLSQETNPSSTTSMTMTTTSFDTPTAKSTSQNPTVPPTTTTTTATTHEIKPEAEQNEKTQESSSTTAKSTPMASLKKESRTEDHPPIYYSPQQQVKLEHYDSKLSNQQEMAYTPAFRRRKNFDNTATTNFVRTTLDAYPSGQTPNTPANYNPYTSLTGYNLGVYPNQYLFGMSTPLPPSFFSTSLYGIPNVAAFSYQIPNYDRFGQGFNPFSLPFNGGNSFGGIGYPIYNNGQQFGSYGQQMFGNSRYSQQFGTNGVYGQPFGTIGGYSPQFGANGGSGQNFGAYDIYGQQFGSGNEYGQQFVSNGPYSQPIGGFNQQFGGINPLFGGLGQPFPGFTGYRDMFNSLGPFQSDINNSYDNSDNDARRNITQDRPRPEVATFNRYNIYGGGPVLKTTSDQMEYGNIGGNGVVPIQPLGIAIPNSLPPMMGMTAVLAGPPVIATPVFNVGSPAPEAPSPQQIPPQPPIGTQNNHDNFQTNMLHQNTPRNPNYPNMMQNENFQKGMDGDHNSDQNRSNESGNDDNRHDSQMNQRPPMRQMENGPSRQIVGMHFRPAQRTRSKTNCGRNSKPLATNRMDVNDKWTITNILKGKHTPSTEHGTENIPTTTTTQYPKAEWQLQQRPKEIPPITRVDGIYINNPLLRNFYKESNDGKLRTFHLTTPAKVNVETTSEKKSPKKHTTPTRFPTKKRKPKRKGTSEKNRETQTPKLAKYSSFIILNGGRYRDTPTPLFWRNFPLLRPSFSTRYRHSDQSENRRPNEHGFQSDWEPLPNGIQFIGSVSDGKRKLVYDRKLFNRRNNMAISIHHPYNAMKWRLQLTQ